MIKVERENVEIEGSGEIVLAELTMAIKHVKIALMEAGMPKEEVDEAVSDAVRLADMSAKEVAKEIVEHLAKLLDLADF